MVVNPNGQTTVLAQLGYSSCGKGKQRQLIEARAAVHTAHIETSEVIRKYESSEQKRIRELEGKLLDPLWVAEKVLLEMQPLIAAGVQLLILDGATRTGAQTVEILKALAKNQRIRNVLAIEYDTPREICEARMINPADDRPFRLDDKSAESRKNKLDLFETHIGDVVSVFRRFNVPIHIIKNHHNREPEYVWNETMRTVQALSKLIRSEFQHNPNYGFKISPAPKRFWSMSASVI